jgi:NAD(P)-dependent dehydrogenase (short-subunit alcohol dehydrogenase family)
MSATRAAVFAAVETAADAFGRLDIVINNAGYGLTGAVEEITEDAAREIIDTNFFGTLWVCQAVAPHLRARRSGRIVQMSSIAGLTGLPTQGLYAASKFAVEGMSESLAHELASFGITVTLVDPGAHATGFTGPSLRFAEFTDAYQPVRAALIERYAHASFGDPPRVAEAILAIVNDPKPPRRVLLGGEYDMIMDLYRQRQEEWAGLAASQPGRRLSRCYHVAAAARGPVCSEQEHLVHPSGIGPRSSSRPARIRGHWAAGRPSSRNWPPWEPQRCGQPSGESSQNSCRP